MENYSQPLDELIKEALSLGGAAKGAWKGLEFGPEGAAIGALLGGMQIKDILTQIKDPDILGGPFSIALKLVPEEKREELVSKIEEIMKKNNLSEDDTATDVVIGLVENFISPSKEETEEKAPEGKAPEDSFAGINSLDHLFKFALERKRFHIEQLHQELGNVIAEIKRNIGETTFKVLGSMDIIYNSSEQDIEEVTEEFKNAVNNAIQDLEELKGKSFSSVDEKIVNMQRRLKYLMGTSIETPEEK